MVSRSSSQRRPSRPRGRPQVRRKLNPLPFVLGGVAIVAIIAAFFAWSHFNPRTGGAPSATCFLLIDRTSSAVESSASPESYQEMADLSIAGCAERSAALLIGSFDQNGTSIALADNPDGDPAQPKVFRLYDGEARTATKRELQKNADMAAASDAVASILESTVDNNRNSDILTAFDQAATELHQLAIDEQVDDLFLVALTDGVQISDSYSFEAFAEGDSAQSHVDDALAAGNQADLAGIQVSFAGVDTGGSVDGAQLPSWFSQQMEGFWDVFVVTSGGAFCYYGPDPIGLPVSC